MNPQSFIPDLNSFGEIDWAGLDQRQPTANHQFKNSCGHGRMPPPQNYYGPQGNQWDNSPNNYPQNNSIFNHNGFQQHPNFNLHPQNHRQATSRAQYNQNMYYGSTDGSDNTSTESYDNNYPRNKNPPFSPHFQGNRPLKHHQNAPYGGQQQPNHGYRYPSTGPQFSAKAANPLPFPKVFKDTNPCEGQNTQLSATKAYFSPACTPPYVPFLMKGKFVKPGPKSMPHRMLNMGIVYTVKKSTFSRFFCRFTWFLLFSSLICRLFSSVPVMIMC